ncbi:MAG: potassium channel family protein [Actinomycetota bacterium]
MSVVAIVVGVVLVVSVLGDLVNTLVTTTRARGRWWLTVILYTRTWTVIRTVGHRMPPERRERFYGAFAPISVIVMLLVWVLLQVVGFGLIWWGIGGVDGADSLFDSLYYSGVVYFTLGFGEIVPTDVVPRVGALIEAFAGVLSTALVIGYLPALYSAYSAREQKLLTLDDGTEDRITPTNLVVARCPTGDPSDMDQFFAEWELWVAQVMETHTTFRMLVLFRSQHPGQNWLTALGVVMDAALHIELMEGHQGGPAYWMLRRGTRLLQLVTEDLDLSEKRAEVEREIDADSEERFFVPLYETLAEHGFPMLPYAVAAEHSRGLREKYAVELEFMIDALDAPRGFWGHAIGHQLDSPHFLAPE